MQVVIERVAGLDMHNTVTACVRTRTSVRARPADAVADQKFGTFTKELKALRDWLASRRW